MFRVSITETESTAPGNRNSLRNRIPHVLVVVLVGLLIKHFLGDLADVFVNLRSPTTPSPSSPTPPSPSSPTPPSPSSPTPHSPSSPAPPSPSFSTHPSPSSPTPPSPSSPTPPPPSSPTPPSSSPSSNPSNESSSSDSTDKNKFIKIELKQKPKKKRKTKNYDVTNMQLVMAWPPGVCNESDTCWEQVEPTRFYIHGLWPADSFGRNKQYCGAQIEYDEASFPADLQSLGVEMNQQLHDRWPSYAKGQTFSQTQSEESPKFWLHEYKSHGTCADMTFGDYFRRVLEKGGNLKIENWLAEILTETTTSYMIEVFENAFRPHFGDNNFYVKCIEDNRLKEIIFCLDKQARKFTSCPHSSKDKGCDRESPVIFHKRWTYE